MISQSLIIIVICFL